MFAFVTNDLVVLRVVVVVLLVVVGGVVVVVVVVVEVTAVVVVVVVVVVDVVETVVDGNSFNLCLKVSRQSLPISSSYTGAAGVVVCSGTGLLNRNPG